MNERQALKSRLRVVPAFGQRDLLGEERKVEGELMELHEKVQQREMEILKVERELKEVYWKAPSK